MANIASLLKEEVARLTRKEVRVETEQLRKASAKYRSEIASLKKRVMDLERVISRLAKQLDRAPQAELLQTTKQVRFSASGFKKLREKHGLSAAIMGSILSVTPQTIYSWEGGNTRPGAEYIEKIAVLRQMGKRQLTEALKEMHPQ